MPIDPNKVKWDDAPTIDPSKVQWDEPKAKVQPVSRLEKVLTGATDPIHGGAQLLTKALPDSVVQAGNKFNNWLADKTGLVARLPEGGVDQQVRQREADYQAKRAAAGESGFDGWRTVGNVLSPANRAIPVGTSLNLGGRVVKGVVGGAVGGALSPVTSGDFWSEKTNQATAGAAFGGATPVLASGVSRVISPKASTNPAVQALRAEGVTPTPGQVLGGFAKRTEEGLASVPLIGTFIRNAQGRANADLNRAVANRALSPVGGKLPEGLAGSDAVEYVGSELGKRYDDLLPSLTVRADQQFATEVGSLRKMVRDGAIDPKYASAFDRFMNDNVLSKFRGRGALTGQTIKDIEGDLGQKAARLAQSQDPDARLMADALKEVQSNLRGLVARSNPAASKELKAINSGYANFKRMERAASSVAAEDGLFSPAQLHSAVKALDRSKDKAAFARGGALMQDLSRNAKAVLGNRVPDSGTAERALTAGMFLDPRAYAAALTAPLLYSQLGQKVSAGLLASRPQGANAVADALRQASPGLGLLAGQVGAGLLR